MGDAGLVKRLAGAVEVYDGVFQDCERLVAIAEAQTWQRATVRTNDVDPVRTNTNTFIDLRSLTNPTFVYEFGRTLFGFLDDYGKRFGVGFASLEPVSINRYEPGQRYEPHADDGPGHPRIISALVYLNDVAEGGATYFPYFDLRIEAIAGRLVIFPSNYAYTHAAEPPISGVKYSLAAWTNPIN